MRRNSDCVGAGAGVGAVDWVCELAVRALEFGGSDAAAGLRSELNNRSAESAMSPTARQEGIRTREKEREERIKHSLRNEVRETRNKEAEGLAVASFSGPVSGVRRYAFINWTVGSGHQ